MNPDAFVFDDPKHSGKRLALQVFEQPACGGFCGDMRLASQAEDNDAWSLARRVPPDVGKLQIVRYQCALFLFANFKHAFVWLPTERLLDHRHHVVSCSGEHRSK